MKNKTVGHANTAVYLVLLGIVFGALYWILESAIHSYLLHQGSLSQQVFQPGAHEIWVRLCALCIIIFLGIYTQFIVIRRKQAEERIRHLHFVVRAIRSVSQLIAGERIPDRLIKGVCDILIKTDGYHSAWLALFDESGGVVATAEAGLGGDFLPLVERLKHGGLPDCAGIALMRSDIVIIKAPSSTCADCPIREKCPSRAAMTVRLEYEGKVYGLLCASGTIEFATDDEEESLLKEVAGDIAFALHNIELEKERKRAQEALQAYQRAIESLDDGVVAVDGRFVYNLVNEAFLRYHGLKRDQVIGHTVAEVVGEEGFATKIKPNLDRCLRGEPVQYEILHHSPELGDRRLAVSCFPLKPSRQEIMGVVALIKDITELKQMEEERLRAAKLESMATLAAGIAHDFNNILTGIMGHISLAKMETDLDHPAFETLTEAEKAMQRAKDLTQQLLTFSKGGASTKKIISTSELIKEATTSVLSRSD
jgi:PAS domain S-box-containing protein